MLKNPPCTTSTIANGIQSGALPKTSRIRLRILKVKTQIIIKWRFQIKPLVSFSSNEFKCLSFFAFCATVRHIMEQ